MDPRTPYLLQKYFNAYEITMNTFHKHSYFCKSANLEINSLEIVRADFFSKIWKHCKFEIFYLVRCNFKTSERFILFF